MQVYVYAISRDKIATYPIIYNMPQDGFALQCESTGTSNYLFADVTLDREAICVADND